MTLCEEASACRPELILYHRDPRRAVVLGDAFRQRGFRVHVARSGWEARSLAQALVLPTVVLGTDQPEESGWLTCAKLRLAQPYLRVFLVAPTVTAERRRFADFLGAAGLVPQDDPRVLVRAVCGTPLPAVG